MIWACSRAQSPIERMKLSDLDFIAERPLLTEISDSLFTAIGEACLVNFARMKFEKDTVAANKLKASLDTGNPASDDKKIRFPVIIPSNGYIILNPLLYSLEAVSIAFATWLALKDMNFYLKDDFQFTG